MDKVKLEIKTPENKIIIYNSVEIQVTPFITLPQQVFLINDYVKEYFGTPDTILVEKSKRHFLEAEYKLKNYIFRLITNIDMINVPDDIYVDFLLWEKITNEIDNYYDFRDMLDRVIQDIEQQETLDNSIGKVMSDLIEKGYELLNKFSNMNPETIKEAGEKGLELIERLEKSSVMKNPSDMAAIAETSLQETITEAPIKKKRGRAKKE